jgi:hypothetical protein
MPGRERLIQIGKRRGDRLIREVAQIGLGGRLGLGMPRRTVAASLRVSESKLARWERGEAPHPDLAECATWMRVLGQDLVVKCYPTGSPLRDVAHAQLVSRLVALLPAGHPRTIEAPIPVDRDLRAWDVLIPFGQRLMGVACETRLRDGQDLLRREHAKARDSSVDYLLLVLADTHTNRRAVHDAGPALREALPVDGRTMRAALQAGRDPGGSGILFL